jgi:hypothetical protein
MQRERGDQRSARRRGRRRRRQQRRAQQHTREGAVSWDGALLFRPGARATALPLRPIIQHRHSQSTARPNLPPKRIASRLSQSRKERREAARLFSCLARLRAAPSARPTRPNLGRAPLVLSRQQQQPCRRASATNSVRRLGATNRNASRVDARRRRLRDDGPAGSKKRSRSPQKTKHH